MDPNLIYLLMIQKMGKKIKEISFRGPITSGSDVMEAVSEMFEGGE